MHLVALLHKTLKDKLPDVHEMRLKSLMTACHAAIRNNILSLTGLGRAILNTNKASSNIQKVDRLLGNSHLQAERGSFYEAIFSHVIKEDSEPWLHIDWACINPLTNLYVLRASLSMQGRSLVVYEECHPKCKENNHATHKAFLQRLKKLLPRTVKPVIVTDGGFRAPWFNYILELGWHYVGRLRNKNALLMEGESQWRLSSDYFAQAVTKPTYQGQGLLTKKGKTPVHLVSYKEKSKGRQALTLKKKRRSSSKSKRYSKAHKEPWILVTSLPQAENNPALIVTIYRQRMRIEENIRDTKSPYYGLGLKRSLTSCPQRMNILLLIAAIATFAAWLAGLFIKSVGRATDFQAHSAKFTSVLSDVFLGRQALKKKLLMTQKKFEHLLITLSLCASQTKQESYQCG